MELSGILIRQTEKDDGYSVSFFGWGPTEVFRPTPSAPEGDIRETVAGHIAEEQRGVGWDPLFFGGVVVLPIFDGAGTPAEQLSQGGLREAKRAARRADIGRGHMLAS